METSSQYSDEEQEDTDDTDYEDYEEIYPDDYEDEESDSVSDCESERFKYEDEEFNEDKDYSDEEPEIVCTVSMSSTNSTKQLGSESRRMWDLMVIIITLCIAVLLGLYSLT